MDIDRLISRRNKLTSRRDGLYDHRLISRIDEQLEHVPPGARNDVDLLLGRPCAQLPPRPGYLVNQAITVEDGEALADAMVQAHDDALLFAADQHEDMQQWRWSIGDTAL